MGRFQRSQCSKYCWLIDFKRLLDATSWCRHSSG
jgi:hypothetical protein